MTRLPTHFYEELLAHVSSYALLSEAERAS